MHDSFPTVIYSICEDFELDFFAMYGCVGLWSAFFLVLYSLFDVSRLMRWSTRSTEEIFALFISIAFCVDAFRDTVKSEYRPGGTKAAPEQTGKCNFQQV